MVARGRLKVAAPPARTMPDLRESVAAAIAEMSWLTETDMALADVALAYADQIETAVDRLAEMDLLMAEVAGDPGLMKRIARFEAMCEPTKVVGWLGPQLQSALRDLGGAPLARRAMGTDQPTGSRLAEIRAAAARATGGPPARKRPAKTVDASAR